MVDYRLIDSSTKLPGRKGCVVLDNMKTDPSSLDRKYPIGAIWINRVLGRTWQYVDESVWTMTSPQSLDDYVIGSVSSVDNNIPRFNGITGKLIQDSTLNINDDGQLTNASQPCFSAYPSVNLTNVTGAGIFYSVVFDTAVINQGTHYNPATGVFTAPVDGSYLFNGWMFCTGVAGVTEFVSFIITSNRLYICHASSAIAASASGNLGVNASCIADMDAGDTASLGLAGLGAGSNTVDIQAPVSSFSGYLLC